MFLGSAKQGKKEEQEALKPAEHLNNGTPFVDTPSLQDITFTVEKVRSRDWGVFLGVKVYVLQRWRLNGEDTEQMYFKHLSV